LELSFSDVAAGALPPPPRLAEEGEEGSEDDGLYDIVIISFALHLVETTSELWALLAELSKRARWLVVTVRFSPLFLPFFSCASYSITEALRSSLSSLRPTSSP
jgi:hypothetical protein